MADLAVGPVVASGLTDCTWCTGGWLQNSADTVSSLAYVAAGTAIALGAWRGRLPRAAMVLASATAVEGLGSAWYHGGSGMAAQTLHDLPLIAVMGYLGGWHVGRLLGRRAGAGRAGGPDRGALAGTLSAVAVGGTMWVLSPRSVNAVVALGVATVGVTEVVARVRRLPPVWDRRLLGLVAAAAVAWLVNWSDASVLSAASRLSPHALWHLGTALITVWWVDRAASASHRPS